MEKKTNFKESMDRLDEIVNKLENKDIELEEAIVLFEEGLKLVKECNNSLNNFEDKVNSLIESFEGDKND